MQPGNFIFSDTGNEPIMDIGQSPKTQKSTKSSHLKNMNNAKTGKTIKQNQLNVRVFF